MNQTALPKFLTIPEVAETLGVGQRTVFRWMERGLLRVIRIGNVTRILPEDFQAFLEAHHSEGVGEEVASGPETGA